MRNRGQLNNNPINLRFAHQTEAIGVDNLDFAQFPTPEAGWRAAHAQIQLDMDRKLTIRQFIFKFAPPKENDTNEYLEYVIFRLRVDKDMPLEYISKYALAGLMASMEGYYKKEAT
jgi:hypothetical protein